MNCGGRGGVCSAEFDLILVSRCVHRMLHEMATKSLCPQNVT